jgi:hypothetical protein
MATDYAGSLPANDDQKSAISTAQEGICAAPIAVCLRGRVSLGRRIFLVLAPRPALKLLLSTGECGEIRFVCLYIMSRDPLFLVLLAVLGVGMLATSASYVLDKRDSAH